MISLATQDEVEQIHKKIDAIEEYLNVYEVNSITTTGYKIVLLPNEKNQTPSGK